MGKVIYRHVNVILPSLQGTKQSKEQSHTGLLRDCPAKVRIDLGRSNML